MDARVQIDELQAMLLVMDARIVELESRLAASDVRIAELEQGMATSRDSVGRKDRRRGSEKSQKKPASGRKRGGQPGHRGAHRAPVPEDQVDEFVNLYPSACKNCWVPLPAIEDPKARRHQVVEVLPQQPYTKEFRRHAVICTRCGHKTRAPYDKKKIPSSPFGPRLMGLSGMLSGVYVSRRNTVKLLWDMFGVQISLGAVSTIEARMSGALEPAFDEVGERVEKARVKHTDGTSWREAGISKALWTIATKAGTLFKIVAE
jgi:transposase